MGVDCCRQAFEGLSRRVGKRFLTINKKNNKGKILFKKETF